eukprot:Gregarina_sp_Poly_1__4800@NODE_2559_length_1981_cov_146_012539_g1626_i0_p1_GENE_NODE_2559_length_1981_cov_146_012539_g1626_i0NODE_2559_length_1981_cov_146_012539_g1626_i0_p1_ORF_typecomplete_len277_score43_37Phosducin/PF02114_16/6_7e42HyaE/PF07449_11/0_053Thioredoxin/PF00085_20/0_14RabGAPTBC/PF00566_18/1_2e03RabGAPTBC/PF00566_18/0_26_NODE_2559_length_1981_cov_146_012539_g1626_i089919
MSTTHPVNRTTEWYDLQVKYGNYDPLPEEVKNEDVSRKAQNLLQQIDPLESKNLEELDAVEDVVDEDVLAKYRRERLEELKAQRRLEKFGEVYEITAPEYVQEVTEASKGNKGQQVVVCLLYKDEVKESISLGNILKTLAPRHKEVKFCQGISDKVITNYRDSAVPALLIYKGGRCVRQIVGATLFGGSRMTTDSVEWVMARKLKVMKTDILEDPLATDSPKGSKGTVLRLRRDADDDSSSADEDTERSLDNLASRDRGYGDHAVDQVVDMMRKLM